MPDKEEAFLEILHLEDNAKDAELVKGVLDEAGVKYRIELVKSKDEYLGSLARKRFDLILCDFTIPSFSGKEAFYHAKENSPETPFIFVSGTIGEEVAVQTLVDGATDYVLKPGLKRLVPAIRRALREADERRKLRLAEKMRGMALDDLRSLESRYRGLLESAPDAAIILSGKDVITFVNRQAELTFGYRRDELIGKSISVLVPERFAKAHERSVKAYSVQPHSRPLGSGLELFARRKDGSEFPADIMLSTLLNDQELSILALVRDLTEVKKAERALRESEERFRTIYRASPLAILNIDGEGRFLGCNPAAERLFGYDEKELLGTSFNDMTHPDDVTIGLSVLDEMVAGGKDMARFEKRYVRKDGSVFLAGLTVAAVRDDKDRFSHAVTILDDVTEKRAAEKALLDSEAKYRGLVEGARDAIFSLSLDGTIQSLNPAFESITGFRREDWIGKHVEDVLNSDDRARAISALRSVAEGKDMAVTEFRIMTASGSFIIGELNTAPEVREGKIIGILGIARDVTAQKNLEEELRKAQKLEGLGTLAGGIAHDFNNILGIISGYASLLRRNLGEDAKCRKALDSIETASDRAAALVRQLLTFARKTDRVLTYVDLNKLVDELHRLLSETFPKQIMIRAELHAGAAVVYGDHSELHQLLLNLCVNARDAMMDREDGVLAGGMLTIRTGIVPGQTLQDKFPAATEEEYVSIEVQDTGVGMDESTRSRIFEPFFTTKPIGKGTGLGLATVYGIVQNHGGLIDIKSSPGVGTRFDVYFPARQQGGASVEASEVKPQAVRGGNETILVVEDEPGLREYLEDLLTEEGYKVLSASDGERAISLFFSNSKIRLVLSDVGLPKIGGIDLMEAILATNPETSIILASGFISEQEKKKLSGKGVSSFIQKPYARDDLLRKIRSALETGREPASPPGTK